MYFIKIYKNIKYIIKNINLFMLKKIISLGDFNFNFVKPVCERHGRRRSSILTFILSLSLTYRFYKIRVKIFPKLMIF